MTRDRTNIGQLFEELVQLMERLRSSDGCPWDREQTHESIKRCVIEEAYEVAQAIEDGNMEKLREELGDLLLQVLFHAQMASEDERFTIADVMVGLKHKLLARHPHVFGTAHAETPEQVLEQWHAIKVRERAQQGKDSIMDDLPRTFPALMLAQEVQKRAARIGFDWNCARDAFEKVREEIDEVERALDTDDEQGAKRLIAELGDLLFSIVNVARLRGIDAEDALRQTVSKFINRFRAMEDWAKAHGCMLSDMTLEEMDAIWNAVKSEE
ncbi:MAG TPA: nucleoside triphosphate pyrophosphohydrolase [Armatimonadetes bacterium]|nr:nucleoside triphosphate pyrophosphohydrolase [Armatimonadota bacterium]